VREFEYDINKSNINKKKHGISFEEAKKLWEDNNGIIIPAKEIDDEKRYALIAFIDKCYVTIFTIRDEKYRIISVRRCRKNEEVLYESERV